MDLEERKPRRAPVVNSPPATPRKPPPAEPIVESPNSSFQQQQGNGQLVPVHAGAMVPVMPAGELVLPSAANPALQRLKPDVLHALSAMTGPDSRPPLVYTGDAAAGLSALRNDTLANYRALCRALGEPERTDITSGALPAAAALGINLPQPSNAPLALPPVGGAAVGSFHRLPPISTGGGALLGGARSVPAIMGAPGALSAYSPAAAAASALGSGAGGGLLGGYGALGGGGGGSFIGIGGGTAMGLGSDLGIEAVGSASAYGAHAGAASYRTLSAGNSMYAMPAAPSYGSRAYGGGASAALPSGPRVSVVQGMSRPSDPSSDFLGEESALVFPPAGRTFGGAPSKAALAGISMGSGGYLPHQLAIDPMDDLRYPRPGAGGAGRGRSVQIETLDDFSSFLPGPATKRLNGDNLDRYLQEYAKDRSARPQPIPGLGIGPSPSDRFRCPF